MENQLNTPAKGQDQSAGARTLSERILSVRIRPMIMDDIERVLLIDRLSFTLPWPANSYRFELIENPASLLRVAENSSSVGGLEVVGMIVVWLIVDEAHIATLAVHPDYRGLGISKLLLSTTLRECIQKGAVSATLEVRDSNTIAQNLYRQFGFTIAGRRLHYYHDNHEDAVIMTVTGLDQAYVQQLEHLSFGG
jgi:ribosomal-protein-alanine N-acetyltransferase